MPSLRTRRQTAQLSCPGSAGLYLIPREMPLAPASLGDHL